MRCIYIDQKYPLSKFSSQYTYQYSLVIPAAKVFSFFFALALHLYFYYDTLFQHASEAPLWFLTYIKYIKLYSTVLNE